MIQKDLNFDYIKHEIPNFASLNSFDKMIWLMTCEHSDILNRFAEFIYICFSLRVNSIPSHSYGP